MRKAIVLAGMLGVLTMAGCSGMRQSGDAFVAHGEALRIFGMAIPGDDQQAALDQVPSGATITNVSSTSADWTSFTGFLGNLIGFHSTHIGGTLD